MLSKPSQMEKGKIGCRMSYEKADKHQKHLNCIKTHLAENRISTDTAASEIQKLGYSFTDAWKMLLEEDLPPKVVKLR